jgi:hypothetical protein
MCEPADPFSIIERTAVSARAAHAGGLMCDLDARWHRRTVSAVAQAEQAE